MNTFRKRSQVRRYRIEVIFFIPDRTVTEIVGQNKYKVWFDFRFSNFVSFIDW